MKVKKDLLKMKKKKNKLEHTTNSSIMKAKKTKLKKMKNNNEVAEAVKKEFSDGQKESGTKEPLRQKTWYAYLKVFLAHEKLSEKHTQIMEFCTNKSMTPPRRKQKFLRFIRHCFENQREVTDEQCNELFDLLLEKYDDYKTGKYAVSTNNDASSSESSEPSTSNLNKTKKRKLNLKTNPDSKRLMPITQNEEKKEKTKLKKKKRQKALKDSADVDDEMSE